MSSFEFMAENQEAYQQLLAWLEVGPENLRLIREALFDRLFPSHTGTRDVLRFRYIVVPLTLDIMDAFYPASCVIEANQFFFNSLDQCEKQDDGLVPLELSRSFVRYLAGLMVLGPDQISSAVIADLTNQCFPQLTELFASDDEIRRPQSGFVPYARFAFNLKSLLVSSFHNHSQITRTI